MMGKLGLDKLLFLALIAMLISVQAMLTEQPQPTQMVSSGLSFLKTPRKHPPSRWEIPFGL